MSISWKKWLRESKIVEKVIDSYPITDRESERLRSTEGGSVKIVYGSL